VMVGINNTFAGENPMVDSVFAGIKAIVAAVHECQPEALVVLESLLPTNEGAKNRDVVRPVNERLPALCASEPFADYVHYLDLYHSFVDPEGKQLTGYFNDGLHPNQAGYGIWRDRLVPFLAGLRASPRPGARKKRLRSGSLGRLGYPGTPCPRSAAGTHITPRPVFRA
jgi:lysophospholipase L1-like esterase